MYAMKKIYLVVCEGPSEVAYIQELNRYLDENDYSFTFQTYCVGNGHYTAVKAKYDKARKDNRNTSINVWVDRDIYIRNDSGDKEKYANKPSGVVDFWFDDNNFEDFIAMHMEEELCQKWQEICISHEHFEHPLTEEKYLPLFRDNIHADYQKGCMPFSITTEVLRLALSRQNNPNIKFKSGFLGFLSSKLSDKSSD